MNVAKLVHRAAAFLVVGCLGGCVFVEPVAKSFGTRQRVVIQQDYAGYEDIQALNQFTVSLRGRGSESVSSQLNEIAHAFEQSPNVVNRFKYVLALFYAGENEANLQKALSLLGDKTVSEKEAAAFWLFFADQFGAMLERQLRAITLQNQLHGDQARLIANIVELRAENDSLKKELQEKAAQLSKVEGQVKQLKTIEKSILERNQTEDVVKP